MAKRATPWKEGKVISIETRKGIFVLAQMLKKPFLRFYNTFREDENWGKIDLHLFDTLFSKAIITGSFLRHSEVKVLKDALPDTTREESDTWIQQNSGSRTVNVWRGTDQEKEFIILGSEAGGSLVKKDLWWQPTPVQPVRPHISGVIDAVVLDKIPLDADDLIDGHELTNLSLYPSLNERLYLCYKLNRNVDPYRDLVFDRHIPKEYQVAIEIMAAGANKEEKERILHTYFMH